MLGIQLMSALSDPYREFDDKSVLVTGGTGTFGKRFIKNLLTRSAVRRVVVYSRDEFKQSEMQQQFKDSLSVLRFFIGDVRDGQRLQLAARETDIIVHSAALKQVPAAEYNPFECIRTNIIGAENVVHAALNNGVEKVLALSTDKAANPINLYGATKLASDKIFVAANNLSGSIGTRFSVVRYGNVMGSRGSVIPYFLSLGGNDRLPITDPAMTRFMVALEAGVELVWHAFEDMEGGEIYVTKAPSMRLGDIASAVAPTAEQQIVGVRPGEKLHEQLIGADDAPHTYEYERCYKILPAIDAPGNDGRVKGGRKVDPGFAYTSDRNGEWMSIDALRQWIAANRAALTAP